MDFDKVRFLTVGKIIHAAQKYYKRNSRGCQEALPPGVFRGDV
nr:hypothetical protein [uncultured Oscillibacter sp.]